MTSITHTAPANSTYPAPSFSLTSILAAFFMVDLREKLDAATAGDKSAAAHAYGL
jgi:hypothetical protein